MLRSLKKLWNVYVERWPIRKPSRRDHLGSHRYSSKQIRFLFGSTKGQPRNCDADSHCGCRRFNWIFTWSHAEGDVQDDTHVLQLARQHQSSSTLPSKKNKSIYYYFLFAKVVIYFFSMLTNWQKCPPKIFTMRRTGILRTNFFICNSKTCLEYECIDYITYSQAPISGPVSSNLKNEQLNFC